MKLIFVFLCVICMTCCISQPGQAQSRDFFEDVSYIRLSLNFKDYILVDNDSFRTKDRYAESKQTFLKTDSSEFIVVRLTRRFPKQTDSINTSNKSQDRRGDGGTNNGDAHGKMNEKTLEKLGASFGFFASNIDFRPSVGQYAVKSGAFMGHPLGVVSLEVYKTRELHKAKVKDKKFLIFVSDFVSFNN
ncbi:hypothetical protein [Parapedobacter sp. 10938]|uniref:hypothetical protein n=1 Tax=Parapedobacter flavus TaxID=3110225 RepID=UPI002DBFA1E2|nr:hypothetical protein [Parapedobacter sp. 10938]MEC3878991.1 hypothetical protein [Parapedobacter sp. 10938]